MAEVQPPAGAATTFGPMLQYWRRTRRLSQLALAHLADVSPRHVCFVETGRARPSREMVLLLASALDVPLRERNALLLAAGFAPVYGETSLDAPEVGAVREALDAILKQQEPYPAVVMDRRWDIRRTNAGAERFFRFLLVDGFDAAPGNVIKTVFHPSGLRPYIANWEAVARTLMHRIQREALGGVKDAAAEELVEEVLAYPDIPASLRTPALEQPLVPFIPVSFERDGRRFDYFSTVTTLGTPLDVTLQELRIECFFPANKATEERARELAASV